MFYMFKNIVLRLLQSLFLPFLLELDTGRVWLLVNAG